MSTINICDYCGKSIDGEKCIKVNLRDGVGCFGKVWKFIEICPECTKESMEKICEIFPGVKIDDKFIKLD